MPFAGRTRTDSARDGTRGRPRRPSPGARRGRRAGRRARAGASRRDGLLLEQAQDPGDRDRNQSGRWSARSAARRRPSRARRPTAAARTLSELGRDERRVDRGEVAVEELAAGALLPVRRQPRRRAASSTADAAYANERSIPATSRSGERLRRRSGSDRAGSPSKSRITQSSSAQSVWPRWKSPWLRIIRPAEPACGALAEPLADLLAAPAIGSSASTSSGRSRKTRSISSSTVAVSSASASGLGSSGAKLGSVGVGAERRCASRPSPRRAAAGARGSGRVASASSSSASSQPSSAPGTNSCSTPSVASAGRPTYAYQPASGAMFGKPRSVRKRSSSSSGLIPASSRR